MKADHSLKIDPFKGNAKKLEMSRYIDLELYHRVERTHPFYEEMLEEIHKQIREFIKGKNPARILEIGAGTGLLTAELMQYPNVIVDAVEIDEECCDNIKRHVRNERCACICDDAVTFCRVESYDLVVSTFAHDHIAYNRSDQFVTNIKNNLKEGGIYIMGGEILPFYQDAEERRKALYAYHCYIIEKALRERHFEVAQIEINALKSGLDMKGDFKRHESMFEKEMDISGLSLLSRKKIGPLDTNDVGGVFVYVYCK